MKVCKKLLAIVLTICALSSLIVPSVSAIAPDGTQTFYIAQENEWLDMGQKITVENIDEGRGLYYDSEAAYVSDSEIFALEAATTANKGLLVSLTSKDMWVALELQNVKKGTYSLDIWNQNYSASTIKNGGLFEVYIIPGFDYGAMSRKEMQDKIKASFVKKYKMPELWDNSCNRQDMVDTASYGNVKLESDGSYLMVFRCIGNGAGNTVPDRMHLMLNTITLAPTSGKADVTVKTSQKKPPVMPTETTMASNITDLTGQITEDIALKNAIPTTAYSNSLAFEWNGHDYFVGTMRGGAYIIYNLDTDQLVYSGIAAGGTPEKPAPIGTFRGVSLDGYGKLWFYGASYYLYSFDLNTMQPAGAVKISHGLGITSFNVWKMCWDDETKLFYFGTYNQGSIQTFDPKTGKTENLTGHLDATPDDGLAPDSLYSGCAGVFIKDGYAYIEADGDTNMDGVTSHHIVKFDLKKKKVVDSLDLVAEGVWGLGGHFMLYGKLIGNYLFFGSDSRLNKPCIIDISGNKMKLVEDTGDLDRGITGYISDPIDGKCYFFGNTTDQEGMFELDLATMTITEMNPVDYPRDMAKLFLMGSCLVTIEGDDRLPGTSLITAQYNEYYCYTEWVFHNVQTKQTVIKPIRVNAEGSGNRLTPLGSSPDGKYIYVGAYGDNRVASYNIETGETIHYKTSSHQTDGLAYYNGYLYAGNYQSAAITQVNLEKNQAKVLLNLQNSMFNQARVHALVGGDNKIFAGMVPDKNKIGGVLAWYDFDTNLTYVAAGPTPNDVYYADTTIGGTDYVWRNVVTNKILLNDLDGDGMTDSTELINGVEVQRTHGLVYHQTITSVTYKDGYIFGTTCMGGGSGAAADPDTSAVVFVYDVENMELVAQLDPREAFRGYPGYVEQFDCVAADPDIEGKFWAITAGSLISFEFDFETRQIKNAKEEFVIQRRKYAGGSTWHPNNIVFQGEFMYVSLYGANEDADGIYMLRRDDPTTGYRICKTHTNAEIALGIDNNIYKMNDYDIVRLNTNEVLKPIIDDADVIAVQAMIDALPTEGITLEHEAQIDKVRARYDSTSAEAKARIDATKLIAAETALAPLKAAVVDELINAIGTVTLDSETAITAARAAYEELTELEKTYVTKLSVLVDAEAKLADLKAPQKPATENNGEFPWIIVIVAAAVVAVGAVVVVLVIVLPKKKKGE